MTDEKDVNTTTVLNDLFVTLRQYSQTRKTTDTDIFRQRARQYAESSSHKATIIEDSLSVLVFTIGDEHYGLDVMCVESVRDLPAVTRVPNAPSFYCGVVNVRGAVITIIDLRNFFGLEPVRDIRELIVVEALPLTLGIGVETIHGVITLSKAKINPLEDVRYVLGAYNTGSKRVVILDAEEIFHDERLLGVSNG